MYDSNSIDSALGNLDLVTSEEDRVVAFLKPNLKKVNAESAPVRVKDSFYVRYLKRILDIIVAVPIFVITLPFNLIFGICTFFDVGRPIFYRQTRAGKGGKPFTIAKFRNMNNNRSTDGKLLPARERVTRFGSFMRKTSLDELLNFWSVIKGDMSVIGPRPLPLTFTERMSDRHRTRTALRPGLECPRMLKGDPGVCQYQNQFENDVWYVENVSFGTDVKLVVLLFKMTFNFKSRSKASKGAGYFVGYDDKGHATSVNRFKLDYPDAFEHLMDN